MQTPTWLQAGFFLVANAKPPEFPDEPFPENLITVSDCILDIYPELWAMDEDSGVQPEDVELLRQQLGLDAASFAELQQWTRESLEAERVGWPNVFFSASLARAFRDRFLRAKKLRVIGLSLASDAAEIYLKADAKQPSFDGMALHLRRRQPATDGALVRGFDVMGMEHGGGLHSFHCNGLGQDYAEKLGISLNEYGLIRDYEQALAAAEFTRRDDVGAEPVDWLAFRVEEFAD